MPATVCMADFDLPTRSASGFLLRYIVPRLGPVPLYGMIARRFPFRLSAPQSDIIIGMGHGSTTSFTGQNESVILEVGKYKTKEISGKLIKLLSCQSGVTLGPELVTNGALAFIGYKDDYVWVMDSEMAATPWADEMAAACLLPVVDGLNALLDGKTAGEAFETERAGYLANAGVEEDELIKSCLDFNYKNAILLGDTAASIKARPSVSIPLAPPPNILPVSG